MAAVRATPASPSTGETELANSRRPGRGVDQQGDSQFRRGSGGRLLGAARHAVLRPANQRRPRGNDGHRLPDGALLVLTEVKDADRTGRTYDAPIPPAKDWLLEQAVCK
ncbi:hypothetical protein AQJ91_26565 [Streptomyces dysideae]|uniref:Uncharacterized protein n=1 Tax=Streptomyces dysideae TaxID=909626 RepID=A0A117RZS9_9ACTN|nr:hypothetical protein AQJ91_26565 [Streptomyces dysideae]